MHARRSVTIARLRKLNCDLFSETAAYIATRGSIVGDKAGARVTGLVEGDTAVGAAVVGVMVGGAVT